MHILAAWFLLTLTLGPEPPVTTDRVDVIELNILYDEAGEETFRQLIFWQHDQVVAWRIVKREGVAENGALLFHDDGLLRRVRADEFRTVHSQHDRELARRENESWRRGLGRAVRKH